MKKCQNEKNLISTREAENSFLKLPTLIFKVIDKDNQWQKSMTPNELGNILSRMYNTAPRGKSVTMIHLFGIKYAAEIDNCGESAAEIVRLSGLSPSYLTEVYKGIRLAPYVVPRS